MSYSCARCNRTFVKRSVFEQHQARKRPCIIRPASPARPFTQQMVLLKPVLKWVGGKTQLLETILPRFPRTMHHYHEPFLGGGSVLFALLAHRNAGLLTLTGTVHASDTNPALIGLYQCIQKEPEALIREVRALQTEWSHCDTKDINRTPTTLEEALTNRESYYYWTRATFNQLSQEERMSVKGAALLLFLNKTCFRGVYREGPHGFNVPYGNNVNPGIMDEMHIRAVSSLIQEVRFTVMSFEDSLSAVQQGDFVYLDPPYAPESRTSFVSYVAGGFTKHQALFEWCQKGISSWMMSNADVPLVRDFFPLHETIVLSCKRTIHSTKPNTKTNEVLIWHAM